VTAVQPHQVSVHQVSTTVDSAETAQHLATTAVERGLAACAQVSGPLESTYRWQGRVESAREWQVVCKTSVAGTAALLAHLRAAHPYEVPELLVTAVVDGEPDYLRWVVEQVQHG
jgi:periplasmic divalent cation tolerance protein